MGSTIQYIADFFKARRGRSLWRAIVHDDTVISLLWVPMATPWQVVAFISRAFVTFHLLALMGFHELTVTGFHGNTMPVHDSVMGFHGTDRDDIL